MDKVREQYYYVGLYSDGGYAGLDENSGGYPFNAGDSLAQARLYPYTEEGKKRLLEYVGMFKDLTVGKIMVFVFSNIDERTLI